MSYICSHCERTAPDKNLFCTEVYCPLRTEAIIGAGQLVGDARIIRSLHVTKTATFYEARRGDEQVILKLAHQGCEKQLQAEAHLLRDITLDRLRKNRPSGLSRIFRLHYLTAKSDPHPGIPTLLPAYRRGELVEFPHGLAVIHQREVCFLVLEFVQGIPLREYLADTPQPWFFNVAWLVMRVARILDLLNGQFKVLHGKLNPDAIWVYEDDQGYLRPVLMDFGMVIPINQLIEKDNILWLHLHSENAYIPPEIIARDLSQMPKEKLHSTHQMDVYGLGLLLYEMLAGKPRFTHRLLRESTVRRNVKANVINPLRRKDVEMLTAYEPLLRIAEAATRPDPTKRAPSDAGTLYTFLQEKVGRIPPEKVPTTIAQSVAWVVVVSLLLACLVLLAGVAVMPAA